ncbi:TIGR03067 domain-containing protein [Tautonia plasticadhaerens]|uniref:TIGR03067 domain-containing protein n=1 Tax=Tautonia plasticadhaerens TaxID=2527974 RepID=A0A518HBT1_9BACT|nr:TIGR03067 domain-containing protein [Tautonia plasticadhaerens]QDV38323.1 hypothetical protein ElP_62750 [Tautonia plasticadhaerens]
MIGLAALLPILLASPGPDDGAPGRPDDLRRHQGTWAVVRSIRDGEEGPVDAMKEITRVVEGDRVVWERSGEPFAATRFELDPDADPKAIDLIPEGGPNRGEKVLGIYAFEDDLLVLCTADAGRPRPTSFEAGPGSGTTLMTFRRLDPADAPPPGDSP